MLQFGKHMSRLVIHSFFRTEGNYYEMALHHILSVVLILISYLTNFWLVGMFVLLTHDASDALLLIARFYKVMSQYYFSNINFQNRGVLVFWVRLESDHGYY